MDAFSRRGLLHGAAVAGGAVASLAVAPPPAVAASRRKEPGWVTGRLTGAQAVAEALLAEGVACVFGIPGAQENELWDEFKGRGVPYLLTAHEFGAACMADGAARASGRPGVLCVVPGPGVTNALTGLGEALLDSVPVVAIVGDVGNGEKYRPFQVHSLDNVALLRPVTKCVYPVTTVLQIPGTVRQAFRDAAAGEPGPVAVVIPYNLLIEVADFHCPPPADTALAWDEVAAQKAVALLSDRRYRVGIYAGLGCMDQTAVLTAVAEMLQAPVATSVSGKGCIDECHPLAVGWGFGKHASVVAEKAFARDPLHPLRSGVDVLLAVGVKFSEVSTGYYGNPRPKHVVHVDANAANLGKVMPADVCVHADAGLFFGKVLACKETLCRPADDHLVKRIAGLKAEQAADLTAVPAAACGVDPLAVVAALRRAVPANGQLFVDVTVSEHLAAEFYRTTGPRTYFNPVDNQSMGWSIPAAVGACQVSPGKVVATLTGDGCFLMSAMELATAARAGVPVKVVVLDDHAYHYMQLLQQAAYRRTTATELGHIDYAAFARAVGVAYQDVTHAGQLDDALRQAVCHPGPVVVRVQTDYGRRTIRWLEAVRDRYAKDLSAAQKVRFLARIGKRELAVRPAAND